MKMFVSLLSYLALMLNLLVPCSVNAGLGLLRALRDLSKLAAMINSLRPPDSTMQGWAGWAHALKPARAGLGSRQFRV